MSLLLILYVFASFGIAFGLGYAKISLPLRNWLARISDLHLVGDKIETAELIGYPKLVRFAARWLLALLECPACVAFWLGLISVWTPIVNVIPVGGIPLWVMGPILGVTNMGAVLSLGMITGLIRTE